MLSTRSKLIGIGLNIAKNLNSSGPKIGITKKFVCRYSSVQVDVGDKILSPMEDVSGNKKKNNHKVTGITLNPYRSLPMKSDREFSGASGSNLVLRFKSLAKSTERNPVVIQNICNDLLHEDPKLSVKEYVDILYCLSKLNFYDEKLLMKILNAITALLDDIYKPSPLINTISKSMRNLLLRHTEALNGIIEWFSSRRASVDMSNAAETIRTLAVLNHFPANAEVLLQPMLNCEMGEYSSSVKYLNFVWSATLIDRVQPEMAENVMLPSFRKKLESLLPVEGRYPVYLKLINIQAHANARKFKIKMNSNWQSMENTWLYHMKEKKRSNAIVKSFIDCLANILPPRTFNTFVESSSGCIIDAVCFFDNNHTPITELEFKKKNYTIKLALLVLSYKDLCAPEKTIPNGIIKFHTRWLTESGYKVMYIPFNEFPVEANLLKKSAYLKEKFETILPNYGKSRKHTLD